MTTPIRPSEATLIEVRQALQRIELNRRTGAQHNFTASTNPTITDDESTGYSASSFWYNATSDLLWVCLDATVGRADWQNLFGSGVIAGSGPSFAVVDPPSGGMIAANIKGDTLNLAASGGMTITGDGVDRITFDSSKGEHHVTLLAESEVEALVLKYIVTTTDLTLTSSHTMVYCDALSRPIVLTLPAASSNGGKLYVAVKVDLSANTVTFENGDFVAVLTVQDEAVPVSSDGTVWRVAF